MNNSRRFCFAYLVQVRKTEDSPWEDLDIMVSKPGEAVRQVLKSATYESRNFVRVLRITESDVFCSKTLSGVGVATQDGEQDTEIDFKDCILKPRQ